MHICYIVILKSTLTSLWCNISSRTT